MTLLPGNSLTKDSAILIKVFGVRVSTALFILVQYNFTIHMIYLSVTFKINALLILDHFIDKW